MKKLAAGVITLSLLAPTFVFAEQDRPRYPERAGIRAELRAELREYASTTPGSLQKLGPAVRHVASSTKAFGSTTEMVKARVAAIKQLIAQKREIMKERAEEAKEKAKERFGERVEFHVGKISSRLASTSAHLSGIADRLDTRIDELKGKGFDMGSSVALLAEARADLSKADDAILAVGEALKAAMSTTTPRAAMPAVRAAVKEAEGALWVVKKDLREVLRSIKTESATTSASQ